MRLSSAVLAVLLTLSAVLMGSAASPPALAASRPNIVLVNIDDWSPRAKRLWSGAGRTPALAKFVKAGVEFRNASGSTPLCTPGRANMITGQWGHNSGVTTNAPGLYDPDDNLSIKLKDAGYTTIFAGKFLVSIEKIAPKRADVLPYARGWDQFDLTWKRLSSRYAYFYKYLRWSRPKTTYHGLGRNDHSTKVVAQRASMHIKSAPADKPVFVEMSIFNGHGPHLPMRQFIGDAACKGRADWRGIGYNEANVSDKPAWVQKLPRLKQSAYPLQKRCEEMLTIDYAVQKVRDALKSTGRLGNTLMILTADNGWMMGEHRVSGGKRVPYATPVPLYMWWPQGLGTKPRSISERVSNVDLAPTICELAGCSLPDADGLSLLPLMFGQTDRLNRLFVYEEYLDSIDPAPGWYGLRTTRAYSTSSTWVYTEYRTGARELYDLRKDPFQLRNLIRDPAYKEQRKALHDLLHDSVIRPDNVRWGEYRLDPVPRSPWPDQGAAGPP